MYCVDVLRVGHLMRMRIPSYKNRMSSCSFVRAMCPARCRVGEGLLPECSVGVKPEERRRRPQVNARMTDKGRLLTDSKSLTVVSSLQVSYA